MFKTKILQLIDKDLDNSKHWGCNFNCLEQPWCCEDNNPVTRYICYKNMFISTHIAELLI